MCGIAGILQFQGSVEAAKIQPMLQAIAHRGPDDQGTWVNTDGNVIFGQQRLAIIDVSPLGHQPMVSPDGQYAITYNGEIYNYLELKEELKTLGWTFRSQSDTEVLLYAYMQWGKACVHKLNGMFAFAVWDNTKKELYAARDRLGEKPFKYYFDGKRFIFASELKAILTHADVKREVDWQAIDLAFSYRYVPAPRTGFVGIHKLAAGHELLVRGNTLTVQLYWQPETFARLRTIGNIEEEKQALWELFKDSVKRRMMSDVPLGVFLSGGLDSSSVVAAMAEVATSKIKTFSVGFKDSPESETPFAKIVADRFHTDHTEILIEPNIIDILPKLIYQYEEPFFDNSAVPTMAMAEKTKQYATVVLTGDGGDECFGGYPNYRFLKYVFWYHRLPPMLYRTIIPDIVQAAYRATENKKIGKAFYRSELLSHPLYQAYLDYYAVWQKELHRSTWYMTKDEVYTDRFKSAVNINMSEELMEDWLGAQRLDSYGSMNRGMLSDMARLSDGYMMKVDFGAMAHAVETRPPFLDYRLVERTLSLPEEYKVRGGDVKWIWKQVMQHRLPSVILERKKMGFGIPIISWMRGELYSYVRENLLNGPDILYDYVKKEKIEKLLEDHKSGRADYSNHIWSILLLAQWLRRFFYEQ